MIWVFDTVPSRLNEVYWSNSYEDLKRKLDVRVQYETVKVQQEFENLALVVNQALGGSEKQSPKTVETYDELTSIFSQMGGKVNG